MYSTYEHWRDAAMTGGIDLTVVIPAYNEQERIVPTIGALAGYLSTTSLSWELLVADDGSQDATRELVGMLGHANIRVLAAPINTGKGDAVRRGLRAAEGRMVLFADADNATPAHELGGLIAALEGGADIAIGSRAISGAQVNFRSPLRRVMTAGLHLVVRTLLGVRVRDTQCGFKLFTREAAHRIAAAQTVAGFSFDLELLLLAQRLGYAIAEVPVTWYDAPGSKVAPLREAARFVRSVVAIRIKSMRGDYRHA